MSIRMRMFPRGRSRAIVRRGGCPGVPFSRSYITTDWKCDRGVTSLQIGGIRFGFPIVVETANRLINTPSNPIKEGFFDRTRQIYAVLG